MDLGLRGKRALVTGASQGIGRAVAESLASEGCHLHLVARHGDALDAVRVTLASAHEVEVTTHAVDLAVRGAVSTLAGLCADVDIVVNNAGNTPRGDIFAVDEDTWRSGWELKLFGYINMTREFYRRMKARRSGVIVNVIGIAAEKLEYAYTAGATGNAALVALTRAVGSVSLDYGVRVVGVNPGWVETEKAKRSLRRRATEELGDAERWPELVQHWPRGHLIAPREIADVVAFVASDRAGAMSGSIVTVDAGFAARGYPHIVERNAAAGDEA
ncbi:MAG TPA: short-chain dehydrogenase/reductase [Casimicrobiaceae bacterium]|nr:short-chain dehydrogenase/reductase [Casimicrobiaceae bacterium]